MKFNSLSNEAVEQYRKNTILLSLTACGLKITGLKIGANVADF